jgi:hypothetical protein
MGKIVLLIGFFGILGCNQKLDLANVFPYIITKDYLTESVIKETIIIDTLSDGLFVTLVKDLKGTVENVKKSELEQSGIPIKEAYDSAIKNLDNVLRSQVIKPILFTGPNDLPFIIFTDHWLSAVSVLSTDMYSFSSNILKSDSIYISIPQRDVLILFAKCNTSQLNDFKKIIKEKESEAKKPLTFDIFRLNIKGIQKIE